MVSYFANGRCERGSVTAHFENIGGEIKAQILQAKESVKVCVAWITLRDIRDALISLAGRGVKVDVIYNDDFKNKNLALPLVDNLKFYPVKLAPYYAIMHNKFCIIDESTIITGSFNWSKSAGMHFENCIVIKNNFELVKQFLHEFYDIVSYFSESRDIQKAMCSHVGCRSESFRIGMLGRESGLYDESTIGIWEVCRTKGHLRFLREEQVTHLSMHLGLNVEDDWSSDDEGYKLDKSAMQYQFSREQNCTQRIQDLFEQVGAKIHAVGEVFMTNSDEHIEWSEEPEYGVNMLWRSMYYRKAIPAIICDGDNDVDLTPIVNLHYHQS